MRIWEKRTNTACDDGKPAGIFRRLRHSTSELGAKDMTASSFGRNCKDEMELYRGCI